MDQYIFRLYISGRTPKSNLALSNLQTLCDRTFPGQYQITVIDVLEEPARADEERVLATPTLIKAYPPPTRRIIGDLTDIELVMRGIGVSD
jgi:circadian clock protein KaiB